MFNHIPGSFERKCELMEDEIDRIYRTLVTQVERFPRSKAGRKRLPLLLAFPDYPQRKLDGWSILDVKINDGLHYHGVVLVHTESRLKIGLDIHMAESLDMCGRAMRWEGSISSPSMSSAPRRPLDMGSRHWNGEFQTVTGSLFALGQGASYRWAKDIRNRDQISKPKKLGASTLSALLLSLERLQDIDFEGKGILWTTHAAWVL
jgi:hypothetical protein